MAIRPDVPNRRSIRLRGRDYSMAGHYFVTICTQKMECLFGHIVHQKERLNAGGRMIGHWFKEIERAFPHVTIEALAIMPNHVHTIIWIHRSPRTPDWNGKRPTLGRIIQWVKTMTTNAYIRGVKNRGWPRFDRRLWQRDYFERIIRDEDEHMRVSHYIRMNPVWWNQDPYNPRRLK